MADAKAGASGRGPRVVGAIWPRSWPVSRQAQPVSAGRGCNAVVDVELTEDMADVDADRLGAQEQQLGDLPVRLAVRQVAEDL